VKIQLERLTQNKAAGPGGVSPRVLKACVEQLCGILQHPFNLSLSQEKVPMSWKASCLVPGPKVNLIYLPSVTTAHIIKVFERLVQFFTTAMTRL